MIIKNNNLNLKQIAESGQAFRWYPNEDGYILVANHEAVRINQKENIITIDSESASWHDYFDMDRNYGEIAGYYSSKDEYLSLAVEYGSGIRILNQDPIEMIVTFMISANNNIKRITESIRKLSERYGKFLREVDGIKYYDFPELYSLKKLSIEDFRDCGVGYRDKYLYEFAQNAISEDVYSWRSLNDEELMSKLLSLKGVGEKVANCIILFGYGRIEGFPIDTWIKKTLMEAYDLKENELKDFAESYFKPYGGIAQQYLFYYGRIK